MPAERLDPYENAEAQFELAELWKPRDPSAYGLEGDLAPLIVQQVIGSGVNRVAGYRFGALYADARGEIRVDTSRPTVYYATRTVMIHEVDHRQIDFLWFYPSGKQGLLNHTLRFRGVSLLLDADGFPLAGQAMEAAFGPDSVASNRSTRRVLFVWTSLEKRAAEVFGSPLPGRRYSVERSVEEAPDTVVARLIEDGPIPMGPYVYLAARPHEVTTLLCRCSPSQVERFVKSGYYELRPLEDVDSMLTETPGLSAWQATGKGTPISGDNLDLVDVLRWPAGRVVPTGRQETEGNDPP